MGTALALLLGIVFGLIGPVVGLIIVAVKASGRARTLGMIGFLVAAGVGVIEQVVSRFIPLIMYKLHLPMSVISNVWSVFAVLIGVIPLIILALAVAANRATPPQPASGQPMPQPYGYNQPH